MQSKSKLRCERTPEEPPDESVITRARKRAESRLVDTIPTTSALSTKVDICPLVLLKRVP